MIMIALLLGYGLIEIPRNIYYKNNLKVKLNKLYFELVYIDEDLTVAKEELYQIVQFMKTFQSTISHHYPELITYLNKVSDKILSILQYSIDGINSRHIEPLELITLLNSKDIYHLDDIISLHIFVMKLERKLYLTQSQWMKLLIVVLHCKKN